MTALEDEFLGQLSRRFPPTLVAMTAGLGSERCGAGGRAVGGGRWDVGWLARA